MSDTSPDITPTFQRCASCRYWIKCETQVPGKGGAPTEHPEKICAFSRQMGYGLHGQDGRAIITPPQFGCINWDWAGPPPATEPPHISLPAAMMQKDGETITRGLKTYTFRSNADFFERKDIQIGTTPEATAANITAATGITVHIIP